MIAYGKHPLHIQKLIAKHLPQNDGRYFRANSHLDKVADVMCVLRPGLIFGELSRSELRQLATTAEAAVVERDGPVPLFNRNVLRKASTPKYLG